MAEGKNIVNVYTEWIETFEALSDEDAGKLIKHFFRYVNDLNPEYESDIIKMSFIPIRQQLKRDLKKWLTKSEKNKANANMRWHKENANACERIKPNAKHADKVEVEDKDKEEDINSIYSLYPSKCPINNSNTGKTKKHKDKINTLLKEYSFDDLKARIEWYISDCKQHNRFIKNFGTFLNNIPEIEEKPKKPPLFECTYAMTIKRYEVSTEEEAKIKFFNNSGVYPELIEKIR